MTDQMRRYLQYLTEQAALRRKVNGGLVPGDGRQAERLHDLDNRLMPKLMAEM